MIRRARAVWHGTGREGTGEVTTSSEELLHTPYSYESRFISHHGTNPEELIAAAHAACFTLAVAFQIQQAGHSPRELSAEAAVTVRQDGQGVRISQSALSVVADVPGLDEEMFLELAERAEKTCPVSKLLNAQVSLSATLKQVHTLP